MDIGLFQLENLVANPMPFRLIDLRKRPTPVTEPGLSRLFLKAEQIRHRDLLSSARNAAHPETLPVILFCEDGSESKRAASQLEQLGWTNVLYLEGGLKQARKELL